MRARLILSACAALALAAGARVHADEGHKGSTTAYEPPNDPQRPKAGTESTATGDTSASQSSPSTSGRSSTPGHSSTSSDTSAGSARAPASDPSNRTLTGTIDEVKEDKITVRDDAGMTRELSLDANTRFLREGKSISRRDLQAGDEVRASLQDDKHVSEISVVQSGGESGSKVRARDPGSATLRTPTVGGPEKTAQPGSEAEKSPSTTK